jgi:[ribosomal protein S18]-alanine N-acetyltransferase
MSDQAGLVDAGEADLADLTALEAVASPHPWTEAQLLGELRAPGSRVLLLRGSGPIALLGFCAYQLVADEMHIHDLVVHPEARRRGHGRRLLREALAEAGRRGARRAYLEVRRGNTPASALYASFGFRESGSRAGYYREPDEDALVLAADVPAQP